MKKLQRLFFWILIFTLLPLCAALAESEGTNPWEKVGVRAGGFYTGLDSLIRIGLTQGTGIEISLEDTLGLDQSLFIFRGDLYYRFSRNLRHRLDLSYAGYFRSSTRTLLEDIEIGDDVINAGTTVDTVFNFQIIKLLYSWSFIQDARVDLGFGGGFYVAPIKLKITGDTFDPKSEVVTVPLPVLGVRADVLITPKLYLREKLDLFYLAVGEFSGGILDQGLGLEYRFWKYAGVGVDFEGFRFGLQSKGGGSALVPGDAKIAVDYTGLLFYARFYY